MSGIRAIDKGSIHRITSGQVVIDLQTAVKELVENSLDAGATVLEVRFKNYGITAIDVIDNGSGIDEDDWDALALKHHTSKLTSFSDLDTMRTFGFRGEALSSLCALCESVSVCTATKPPMGVTLELSPTGKVNSKSKVARQRGTTITLNKLFAPLPVRRKELERHAKREFGKALALLQAYALGPCAAKGVRLTVSNQPDKGQKSVQIRTDGSNSIRGAATAIWGARALDHIVDLKVNFDIERDKHALKRLAAVNPSSTPLAATVHGLVSAFTPGSGRSSPDRQFFFINGRPCLLPKVQKIFTEVYRTFNAPNSQSPVLIVDLVIPTDAYDVNVSPDKRTIFVHHEAGLVEALKSALENAFAPGRSTFGVAPTQTQSKLPGVDSKNGAERLSIKPEGKSKEKPILLSDAEEDEESAHPSARSSMSNAVELTGKRKARDNDNDDSPFLRPISSAATTAAPAVSRTAKKPSVSNSASAPASAIKPPSRNSPSPIISSPNSNLNIVQELSDCEQAANRTSPGTMDVDIAVDSSQTSWGRKLGMGGDVQSSGSWPKRAQTPAILDEQNQSPGDSGDDEDERPRKRRRSVGLSDTEGDDMDVLDAAELQDMELDPDAGADQTNGVENSVQTQPKRAPSNMTTNSQKSPPDTRPRQTQSLRALLSGLAGPGPGTQRRGELVEGEARSENGSDSQIDAGVEEDDDIVETQPAEPTPEIIDLTDDGEAFKTSDLSLPNASFSNRESDDDAIDRPEVIRTISGDDIAVVLRVDLEKIARTWGRLRDEWEAEDIQTAEKNARKIKATAQHEALKAASLDTEADSKRPQGVAIDIAAQALSRTISKSDFASMEILGQFNLGFIVVRRRVDGDLDDLFIVDQHAADEKYNFETLQQTTRIKSQKLFRPQPLELTASDELLALEKIDILRQNGFEIEVQTEPGSDMDVDDTVEVVATPKLALTAQPVSKDTVFDMKDLEELIHRMRDAPSGTTPRCSKARAMFAMRACRKSVMIGMPLNKGQMTSVVRHMGTMDQPWNCPHGRPTMRHLVDMLPNLKQEGRSRRKVDWSNLQDL